MNTNCGFQKHNEAAKETYCSHPHNNLIEPHMCCGTTNCLIFRNIIALETIAEMLYNKYNYNSICPNCNGRGKVLFEQPDIYTKIYDTCPTCSGKCIIIRDIKRG